MSSERHLFRLVLDLRQACHEHEVELHPFHISGERMIACGIDGWSRGNHDMGVSLGHDLRPYLPLDRGAFEREPVLLEYWCRSWMGSDYVKPLEPKDWFWREHQPGIYLWAPPRRRPGECWLRWRCRGTSAHTRSRMFYLPEATLAGGVAPTF